VRREEVAWRAGVVRRAGEARWAWEVRRQGIRRGGRSGEVDREGKWMEGRAAKGKKAVWRGGQGRLGGQGRQEGHGW